MNVCAKVGTASYSIDLLANSLAAAVKASCQPYRKGQQGHMKVSYPHKSNLSGSCQKQGTGLIVANCH